VSAFDTLKLTVTLELWLHYTCMELPSPDERAANTGVTARDAASGPIW
jgi:hypothetical protein